MRKTTIIGYKERCKLVRDGRASDPEYVREVLKRIGNLTLKEYLKGNARAIAAVLRAMPKDASVTRRSSVKRVAYLLVNHVPDNAPREDAILALLLPMYAMERRIRNGN